MYLNHGKMGAYKTVNGIIIAVISVGPIMGIPIIECPVWCFFMKNSGELKNKKCISN